MTGLLASVSSADEAKIALRGRADIIDFKDPLSGALGSLPTANVRAGVESVAGVVPTSATVGDHSIRALETLIKSIEVTASTGVDYIKFGLLDADTTSLTALATILPSVTRRHRLVAVLFADRHHEIAWIPILADAGCIGVMLDTATKSRRDLLSGIGRNALRQFVAVAKQRQLLVGLAGGLKAVDISALAELQPDYLGFRSALCSHGERTQALEPRALANIRDIIDKCNGAKLPIRPTYLSVT
ncbi:MAG: (5-formylfuran-3-yl)methyl phosphate synthase [Thiotrichales bacterium]